MVAAAIVHDDRVDRTSAAAENLARAPECRVFVVQMLRLLWGVELEGARFVYVIQRMQLYYRSKRYTQH